MAAMASELAHLAGAILSGAYIAWSVVERISQVIAKQPLSPGSCSSYASLWVAALLVPVLGRLRGRHRYLRGTRVNGCRPAAVYPHRDPVLGLDLLRATLAALREHRVLQTWDGYFRGVGSSFWMLATGRWILMTNEPDNVKAMLSSQFDAWEIGSLRLRISLLTLGPHAIFSVNGPEWQRARAMIRPSFVRNQIADLECTDRHVDNFLAKLPGDGSKLDIQALLYRFTMDVSTDFMFGYSTNMLTNPTKESLDFAAAFDYVLLTSTTRSRLGWLLLLIPDKKFTDAFNTCHRFIERHVSAALAQQKEKERPYVFLNEIVKSGASHEMVCDQLLALVLGGRDTSASTMSSLFWILARRPDVVEKLRAEISVLEGRKPTWEELKNLKYLNMVVKEALRLWAPVVTNMRTANRDTVLPKGGGPDGQSPLFVPKGTDCRISSYSLHRREEFYGPDAEEFRPERWEDLRPSWEYIPFSGGPRICIGQQFALTQMLYLITRVLQAFDRIEPADDGPMVHAVGTTISLLNGCWVSLTPA